MLIVISLIYLLKVEGIITIGYDDETDVTDKTSFAKKLRHQHVYLCINANIFNVVTYTIIITIFAYNGL